MEVPLIFFVQGLLVFKVCDTRLICGGGGVGVK